MADRYAERDRTLVLVSEKLQQDAYDALSRLGCGRWHSAFEIRVLSERRDSSANVTTDIYEHTRQIISDFADGYVRNIVGYRHVTVDFGRIREEEIPLREVKSAATMEKVLGEELRARRLHWEIFSHEEWGKSNLGLATPAEWVQQFSELGYSQVGKQLLKGLRVVTERELRDAFSVSNDEVVGLRVAYAYIKDDEAGSSSLSIKNVLEHWYHEKDIVELDLSSLEVLQTINKDVLFVFEDGLWSGVELVRRLKKIHESDAFRRGSLQLHFRFGVTSDSGLIAARLFARRERSSRIQFATNPPNYHFKFLHPSAEGKVAEVLDEDDTFIRELLDGVVEPYAFRSEAGWGSARSEAIDTCAEIGRQLVRPYLERKARDRLTRGGNETESSAVAVPDSTVRAWELGACRFASTVVFASSVPKPVLPVMWLSGQVTVRGKTVEWKPLFGDVRRMGRVDHLAG